MACKPNGAGYCQDYDELGQYAGPGTRAENRKRAILMDLDYEMVVHPNPYADDSESLHEIHLAHDVNRYEHIIDYLAPIYGVDPDLVKSIIYMETSRGWYDGLLDMANLNKTIRPMNVHVDYWGELGYSREDLHLPIYNIMAGMFLVKEIKKRIPNATIEQIATVYNSLGATKISNYGARVGRIYWERLWEK